MPASPRTGPRSSVSTPALRPSAAPGEAIRALSADPDQPLGHTPAPVTALHEQSFNPDIPNVARVYDWLLGGKDNFAADRQAAAKLLEAVPGASVAARENRAFLGRTVRFLAEEAGVRQFLDIGAGLPSACAVHEIVRGAVPMPRVVYTDYDPVVVRHAEALLGGSLTTAVVRADVRQPWDLFARPAVRTLINLAEPVAILLVAVLHFVEDHDDPWALVNCYKDLMAPGSFLVISHVTADNLAPEAARQAQAVYEGASAPGVARSREQVAGFFAGLEVVPPGLVDVSGWRPGHIGPPPGPAVFYAGVGRKTSPGRPR
jgi:SAM-dependent methyltransferase